jgi:hypothetical protein
VDAVAAQVPPTVTVQGLLDAAALLDIQPTGWEWSSQLTPLQSLIADVAATINPVFPPACAASFPGEAWKCLIGQYRMPMLTTPFFMNAPQFDECACAAAPRCAAEPGGTMACHARFVTLLTAARPGSRLRSRADVRHGQVRGAAPRARVLASVR